VAGAGRECDFNNKQESYAGEHTNFLRIGRSNRYKTLRDVRVCPLLFRWTSKCF